MFTSSSSLFIIVPSSRIAYKYRFSPFVTFKTLSLLMFKNRCTSSKALLKDFLFLRKEPNIIKLPSDISSIFNFYFFVDNYEKYKNSLSFINDS